MGRSLSFKEVRDVEFNTSESSLSSMFSDNNFECLNQANIEVVESQPQATWRLPDISPNQVYSDLSMFHLHAITRVFVKESISRIQQNNDVNQPISLLNVK